MSRQVYTVVLGLLSLVAARCGGGGGALPDGGANDASLDTSLPTDSSASDGGSEAITGAPDDQWTWVDCPTAVCANGSATGIAINPHAGASSLMIYFEGGGDCVDATSCWGTSPTATNLNGFTQATFDSKVTSNQLVPTLLRSATGNPFATMNMVYVPYCTGDLHSGTVMANLAESDGGTIPTYFYGARDMDVFLTRLVPTFPAMTRIWVVGTSAGGFGTYLNFSRIANAFSVGVDLIDDSGPPIYDRASTTMTNAGLLDIWGTSVPGCETCDSFRQVLDYDLTVQQQFTPPGQFGFLSFLEDTTISTDFGYDASSQYPALMETFSASLPDSGLAATFFVSNYPSHVVETDPALAPYYFPWMSNMVGRDGGWADETHDGGM
jgi:Pectinacetylesterase